METAWYYGSRETIGITEGIYEQNSIDLSGKSIGMQQTFSWREGTPPGTCLGADETSDPATFDRPDRGR